MTMKVAKALIISCAFVVVMSDTPYTPGGKGAVVVAQVSDMLEASKIFPPDNKFMCRVAWVESKYGIDGSTYRPFYYGGIWQVDSIGYIDTKIRPSLFKYHRKILAVFHINWQQTTWKDLTKPLYSGLAARLLLATIPVPIPPAENILAQGEYWKKYYNTPAGKGTVQKFVNAVRMASGCAA
ncbi:hypothetical protein QZH41_012800 [Actinostola sp. cb2023]|nr:hypothetical protein QZH41_012800 [Actinostola sp. cb2023]